MANYDDTFDAVLDGSRVAREAWDGTKYTAMLENNIVLIDAIAGEPMVWPEEEQAAECAPDVDDWIIVPGG